MNVEVILPCVNYSDFLAQTLGSVTRIFGKVTVLTHPNDLDSQKIAIKHSAKIHCTDVWFRSGAKFNKSAAINECLEGMFREKSEGWVLFLDADIFLPTGFSIDFNSLDRKFLYSIRRRMCETEEDWLRYLRGEAKFSDFRIDIPPVINGKVWRHRPTSNPAALSGYFQLWYFSQGGRQDLLPPSENAANYDVEFALTFPENNRFYLEGLEVMHLGLQKTNWDGRVSPLWHGAIQEQE